MSGQTDIDHPLCEECTDTLLEQLDKQLKITEDEQKDYHEFLNKLNDQQALRTESLSQELEEFRKEEAELVMKLESIEQERKKVAEDVEREKEESKKLQDQEKQYWIEYCEYQKELLEYEDDQQRYIQSCAC